MQDTLVTLSSRRMDVQTWAALVQDAVVHLETVKGRGLGRTISRSRQCLLAIPLVWYLLDYFVL